MPKYRAFIRTVYDGDTVTADIELGFGVLLTKQKLRLSCVSAPEVRGEQRPAGLATRDALRDKILKKWVEVESASFKKGKYGRWLVEIFQEGESLNDWLIESGFAKKYE